MTQVSDLVAYRLHIAMLRMRSKTVENLKHLVFKDEKNLLTAQLVRSSSSSIRRYLQMPKHSTRNVLASDARTDVRAM
jgi:hypothetical protein